MPRTTKVSFAVLLTQATDNFPQWAAELGKTARGILKNLPRKTGPYRSPYLTFITVCTLSLYSSQTFRVAASVAMCCSYSSANAYMLMYRQIDPARNKRKYPAWYRVFEKVCQQISLADILQFCSKTVLTDGDLCHSDSMPALCYSESTHGHGLQACIFTLCPSSWNTLPEDIQKTAQNSLP